MQCYNKLIKVYGLAVVATFVFALLARAQTQSSFGLTSSGGGGGGLGGGGTGSFGLSSGTGRSTTGAFGTTGPGGMNSTGSLLGGQGGPYGGGLGTGSFLGASRAGTATGGTFFPGITQVSPLNQYSKNPLTVGMNLNNSAFGQPVYAIVSTTTNTAGTISRPGGFGGSYGGGMGGGAYGAGTTSSTGEAPKYVAVADFGARPSISSRIQVDAQRVLANSTALTKAGSIQVSVDGGVLVLKGRVASEHDRTLAEGIVRLSPGVYDVRNELQIGSAVSANTKP
jgi:hypothetical protein